MEKLRGCSKMCEETSLVMKGLLKTVSQQKWFKNWNMNLNCLLWQARNVMGGWSDALTWYIVLSLIVFS
jgi:hypothetical protein